MEIERKFLVPCLPEGYDAHPFHQIEQAYLCTEPVVRIRQAVSYTHLSFWSPTIARSTAATDFGLFISKCNTIPGSMVRPLRATTGIVITCLLYTSRCV